MARRTQPECYVMRFPLRIYFQANISTTQFSSLYGVQNMEISTPFSIHTQTNTNADIQKANDIGIWWKDRFGVSREIYFETVILCVHAMYARLKEIIQL